MEKLTETQINFLVVTFFKAPDKFLGAPSIAKTLLEKGECIVAGPPKEFGMEALETLLV